MKAGGYGGLQADESDNDALRFLNSLKELKDLRYQIHEAANYCEKSFLNSDEKADVLDNTREYLCRAVVTVVDHLGSVSANLNRRIQNTDRTAETQLRINCIKLKLESCDQYNRNFSLTKIRWSMDLPRRYRRYISPPSYSSTKEVTVNLRGHNEQSVVPVGRESKNEFKTNEEIPLFMYTTPQKICLDRITPKSGLENWIKDLTVMPVNDGISVVPNLVRNPGFQFEESIKGGGNGVKRSLKSMTAEKDIVSRIRRSKWEPSRFLKFRSS